MPSWRQASISFLVRGFRYHRLECVLGLLGLGLTVGALFPAAPQGPFDARTFEPLSDVGVHFSWSGALLEPLGAVGHALCGAPVPKLAAISTLAWLLVAALLWGFLRWRGPLPVKALAAGGAGLTAVIAFLVYTGLYFLIPFPSWHPEVEGRGSVIADLQSHTHYSHDSLVPPGDALDVQGKRGIAVTAITEHKSPTGAFAARRRSRSASGRPAVIPGVELKTPHGYVLGLGLDPGEAVPRDIDSQRELADFVRTVHEEHGGAVISLGWKLDRSGVERMVEAGVDGFEIRNMGHPNVPVKVERFIKQQASEHDLSLVSSSDWHGWTGMWRTWTLVRLPGGDTGSLAENVLAVLRDPQKGKVVPVVAGYLGPTSTWRIALAPFVEAFRYAAELSPRRLLAWWLWIGAVLLLARCTRTARFCPVRVGAGTALSASGALLIWKTAPLALAPASAAADPAFHAEIGSYGLALGCTAFVPVFGSLLFAGWRQARRKFSPGRREAPLTASNA